MVRETSEKFGVPEDNMKLNARTIIFKAVAALHSASADRWHCCGGLSLAKGRTASICTVLASCRLGGSGLK